MEILIKKRGVLKSKLTRIENYLINLQINQDLLEQVTERIEQLHSILEQFENIQFQIESHDECLNAAGQDAERSIFEEKYYSAKALATKFIKNIRREMTPAEGEIGSHAAQSDTASNAEINTAIKSLMDHQTVLADLVSKIPIGPSAVGSDAAGSSPAVVNNQMNNIGQSELRLQPITVPTFNGNFKDWPEFHDLYRNLVHNNNRFSPCEKLQYLKRSLVGNAQGILKNITISDANYEQAYEELVNTFNRKDVIIDSYLQIIMDQQKIHIGSVDTLRSLCSNVNESVRALKALELPTEHWDRWLIFIMCSKLDNESLKLWRRDCAQKPDNQVITFSNLITFINNRIYELTPVKQNVNDAKYTNRNHGQSRLSHSTFATVNSCFMCQGDHGIYSCKRFLNSPIKARREFIQKKGLCFNCIKNKHMVRECTSKSMCKYCDGKHNSLLHELKETDKINNKGSKDDQIQRNHHSQKLSLHSNIEKFGINAVVLPTAVVLVKDISGQFQNCRILLDTGSQVNLISESCVQRLHLNRTNANIPIKGIGSARADFTRGKVELILKSRFNNFEISTQSFILGKVTQHLPSTNIENCNKNMFRNIDLADPYYFTPGKIDMIIGSDIFFVILQNGKIYNGPDSLMAQETKFGWVISGKGLITNLTQSISLHTCINIDQRLKSFWEIEQLETVTAFSDEELQAEEHFVVNHTRNKEGHYVVRLPFNKSSEVLGMSKNSALYTLKSLERRFEKDSILKMEYTKFINEYIDLGHMTQISEDKVKLSECNTFYLPHHAVIKESSSTTKLRVVFDASRKSSTGVSLNQLLLVGPTIQKDIWALLLNFRKNQIAYTADITKMYRQIYVDQRDTPFQRILWRESATEPIKEYELQTVTYGTASAPYLAIRSLKQLALDEGEHYKIGSKELLENFYVDDFMGGSNTLNEALIVKNELTSLLDKGGFKLRKWSSNSEEFVSTIKQDDREVSFSLPLQEDTTIKVLGLRWHPAEDCFTFEVNLDAFENYSKRIILSEISRIYDPLGLLAPCIIVAKLIMQQIWITGAGWDDPLPDDLVRKYNMFRNDLNLLSSFKIERYLNITSTSLIQICGFADASETAYAAVIYLRVIDNGHITIRLLVSKTRVAPIKQISLPRLELCAAHLLAKLIVKYTMNFKTRKKWLQQINNIKVNDIVLLKEENLQPCRWLMGRVVATKPGRDGLVRVATIKTKNGTIDRSVRKLTIFLPTEN